MLMIESRDNSPTFSIWLFLVTLITGINPLSNRKTTSLIILMIVNLITYSFIKYGLTIIRVPFIPYIFNTLLFSIPLIILKQTTQKIIKRQFYSQVNVNKLSREVFINDFKLDMNNQKEMFLINTANYIQTPLRNISNHLKSDLDMADYATKRLSVMVDNLIDYYSIGYRAASIELKEHSAVDILEDITKIYIPIAEFKGLNIIKKYKSLNSSMLCDIKKINQTLHILMDNAVRYTPDGDITINLKKSNGCILVEIKDTGTGIPEKYLNELNNSKTIFEKPFQSGVNLYIANKLINLQGGNLNIETGSNGTTITITVPAGGYTTDKPVLTTGINKRVHKPKGPLIYLYSDNISTTESVYSYIHKEFKSILFNSRPHFLKRLKGKNRPDLVLLSGTEGFKVCKMVRELYSKDELPIIYLEDSIDEVKVEEIIESGFNDFINYNIKEKCFLFKIKRQLNTLYINRELAVKSDIIDFVNLIMQTNTTTKKDNRVISNYLKNIKERISASDYNLEPNEPYEKILELATKHRSFFEKSETISRLIELLPTIKNKRPFSEFVKEFKLTQNHQKILKIMFSGVTDHEEIGKFLGKSKSNISSTLKRIYDKLGVDNQTQLMTNLDNIYMDS